MFARERARVYVYVCVCARVCTYVCERECKHTHARAHAPAHARSGWWWYVPVTKLRSRPRAGTPAEPSMGKADRCD